MNVKKDNLIIVKYSGIPLYREVSLEKIILLIRCLVKFYGIEGFLKNYDIICKHVLDKDKLFNCNLKQYADILLNDLGILRKRKIGKRIKASGYYLQKCYDMKYENQKITFELHKMFINFFFFILNDVLKFMSNYKEKYDSEILCFFKLSDSQFEYISIINDYFPELLCFENINKYVSISLTGPNEYENFGAIDAFKVTINIFNDTQVT